MTVRLRPTSTISTRRRGRGCSAPSAGAVAGATASDGPEGGDGGAGASSGRLARRARAASRRATRAASWGLLTKQFNTGMLLGARRRVEREGALGTPTARVQLAASSGLGLQAG